MTERTFYRLMGLLINIFGVIYKDHYLLLISAFFLLKPIKEK